LDYEKEIIRDFYAVRTDRSNRAFAKVNPDDLVKYFNAFNKTFSFLLSEKFTLKATYHISSNIGAVIGISIGDDNSRKQLTEDSQLQVLNFVKSKQIKKSDTLKILNEDKVKIYNESEFFIIKSNHFKDWTVRQAIKDAKEEISLFIKNLSPTDV
jgi:hypothetical protein